MGNGQQQTEIMPEIEQLKKDDLEIWEEI